MLVQVDCRKKYVFMIRNENLMGFFNIFSLWRIATYNCDWDLKESHKYYLAQRFSWFGRFMLKGSIEQSA
jgi:hypothetical protein